MAAARPLVRGERVPLVRRDANELMDVVCRMAQRQRELRGWLADRRVGVDEHVMAADACYSELLPRLERLEASVEHLAREVVPRRQAARHQRVSVLRQQVSVLRGDVRAQVVSDGTVNHRLGTALIYAGSLLLVWLVLWQLALALGLR